MSHLNRRLLAILVATLTLVGGLIGVTAPVSATNHPGIDWTIRTSPADNLWSSIAYGNGTFVAISLDNSGTDAMTSPDGINWTSRATPSGAQWSAIAFGNGVFVAVGRPGGGDQAMSSPDGINWTTHPVSDSSLWSSLTFGNGLFVALSFSALGTQVMTSPNGSTWTSRTAAAASTWQSLTYGNGTFVAVASNVVAEGVMTSPDGITWTAHDAAANSSWRSVTYGNGLFVAVASFDVGNDLRVMTSPDGITWTAYPAASNNWWSWVTFGNGLFVAVANSGSGDRVMTSPDGVTWTSRTSAADNSWDNVVYGAGVFVAVAFSGVGDRVMTSGTLGAAPTLTAVSITGTKAVGQTLHANAAGVISTPAATTSYQWQSSTDKGPWSNIRRATAANFTVPVSLNGQRIRVIATVANGIIPDASRTSAAVRIVNTPKPEPVLDVAASVKGPQVTLSWLAGRVVPAAPVLSYEVRCAQGDSVVRASRQPAARKATLTVTAHGLWTCRVAAVNAIGRSATSPVKVVAH